MFRRAKNFLADVLQQADMILLALCCAATLFGITMVYSATRYMQTNRLVIIQGCALVLGVVLYLLVSMVDLSEVVKKWKWLTMFNFGFILLLLTPFGRSDGTGNRAWLKFPGFPVSIQPAELVKLTFILVLAYQLVWLKEHRDLKSVPSRCWASICWRSSASIIRSLPIWAAPSSISSSSPASPLPRAWPSAGL